VYQWITEQLALTKRENESVHQTGTLSDDAVESLVIEPQDIVAIDDSKPVSTFPYSTLRVFSDAFPTIVSAASARQWMRLRLKVATQYRDHLEHATTRAQESLNLWQARPECLLLYFVRENLLVTDENLPLPSLYDSKVLGKAFLAVRSVRFPMPLQSGVTRICSTEHSDAAAGIIELRREIERQRIAMDDSSVLRIHESVLNTELDIVSQICSRLSNFSCDINMPLSFINAAKSDAEVTRMLFGRLAEVLFCGAEKKTAAPRPNVSTEISEFDAGFLRALHATAEQVTTLVTLENRRELLEDELFQEFLTHRKQKTTELGSEIMRDIDGWTKDQLSWMSRMTDLIQDVYDQEKELRPRVMASADLTIDMLYPYLAYLTGRPRSLLMMPSGQFAPQNHTLTDDAAPLFNAYKAIIGWTRANREVALSEELLGRLQREVRVTVAQLQSARNDLDTTE
jgi:hypothetical protein